MFCVSISEPNFDECLKSIQGEDLCEIRLDLIPLSLDEVKIIFSQPLQLIATYRPKSGNDEIRKEILKLAIKSGAAMIDLEVENEAEFNSEMVEFAHQFGCKVIISYHNYIGTPSLIELENIKQQCLSTNADIVKIACQANSYQDAARLLGMYDDNQAMVVIGMGDFGKITRITALKLGAPFTFVSKDERRATAPGQFTKHHAETLFNLLN